MAVLIVVLMAIPVAFLIAILREFLIAVLRAIPVAFLIAILRAGPNVSHQRSSAPAGGDYSSFLAAGGVHVT